jgi:alpha-beta hydrolase superfamily lysophospholipase
VLVSPTLQITKLLSYYHGVSRHPLLPPISSFFAHPSISPPFPSQSALKNAPQLTAPLLTIHGDEDPLTDMDGTKAFVLRMVRRERGGGERREEARSKMERESSLSHTNAFNVMHSHMNIVMRSHAEARAAQDEPKHEHWSDPLR